MTIAAVFPGQGSQSMGMLEALADQYYEVRDTFQAASDVLGFDLWSLVQTGPEGDLNRTENTQPAMLAADIAVWRVWKEQGGARPQMMAGHSLGEYSALVAAGAMSLEDAVSVVRLRGQAMQSAVADGAGAMAAILGLDDAVVIKLCADNANGEVVEAVNFNSPGQVVIAGQTTAVDRAVEAATEAGAKRAIKLAVSVPSHCALMTGAAEQLAEKLDTIEIVMPKIPVYQNVDGMVRKNVDGIRQALKEQLYRPVRWVDTVKNMGDDGMVTMLELGPGKVLAGLAKRIDRSIVAVPVFDPATLDKALDTFSE